MHSPSSNISIFHKCLCVTDEIFNCNPDRNCEICGSVSGTSWSPCHVHVCMHNLSSRILWSWLVGCMCASPSLCVYTNTTACCHTNHHCPHTASCKCAYSIMSVSVHALVSAWNTPPSQVAEGEDCHGCKWSSRDSRPAHFGVQCSSQFQLAVAQSSTISYSSSIWINQVAVSCSNLCIC